MFRDPLRRDPLVVGWALVMAVAAFVALSNNTTWTGELQAHRVAGFLKDLAEAFLWSFFVLLLLAWLRARGWRDRRGPRHAGRRPAARSSEPFAPFPWTDRWLRDWREDDARRQANQPAPESASVQPDVTCRHGVADDAPLPVGQAPVLRALGVSHTIVQPGSSVSVTWCFEHCTDVVVDGRSGHPACGETVAQVDTSRRIELMGRNRYGSTPAATATVVAMAVPRLDPVMAPPTVSLHTDVAATVTTSAPIAARLDSFWETQEELRLRLQAPPRVVGVPTSVIDGLRHAVHKTKGESK